MIRYLFPLLLVAHVSLADTPTKLKVLRTIPHSGYSEGLDWYEGFLWNALPTETVKIDPKDGTVVAHFAPATEYNESLVWFKDVPYQVSFHDNGIYKGTFRTGAGGAGQLEWTRVGTTPDAHAWGSATDGKSIVFTGDYSKKLFFFDPKTFKITRTVETVVPDLEDLAWDGQRFWGSSFTQYPGTIFPIDPKTGAISGFYELPDPTECPIVDGLTWDGEALWMTGKHCGKIYRVERPSVRALSGKK